MPRRCTKQKHRSQWAALSAATKATGGLPGFKRAYRCSRCRFPDGQRAWHWTNWSATKNR